MRTEAVHMWKMRRRALVLLACVAAAARADQFTLEHVVAGGGASRARSACFTLDATIGQPALGMLANGSYALDAGFWLTPVPPGDTLFQDGFENCSP